MGTRAFVMYPLNQKGLDEFAGLKRLTSPNIGRVHLPEGESKAIQEMPIWYCEKHGVCISEYETDNVEDEAFDDMYKILLANAETFPELLKIFNELIENGFRELTFVL